MEEKVIWHVGVYKPALALYFIEYWELKKKATTQNLFEGIFLQHRQQKANLSKTW